MVTGDAKAGLPGQGQHIGDLKPFQFFVGCPSAVGMMIFFRDLGNRDIHGHPSPMIWEQPPLQEFNQQEETFPSPEYSVVFLRNV